MKRVGIKIFYFVVLFVNSLNLYSQDVEFSQFYSNKVYLNPAFAGSDFDPRLSLNYRNQWPEINSAYVTYSVAYDQFVSALEGGVGIHIMQDEQGDGAVSTSMINGMYSYSLQITRELFMKFGFQASFIERKINNKNFVYPDQTDEFYINGTINPISGNNQLDHLSRTYFDFSSGFIAAYKNWFIGLAIHHLSEPDQSYLKETNYSKLPRKFTFHCGANVPVFRRGLHRSSYSLAPNFLFQQQGSNKQLNYGLYLSKGSIVLGMWYRDNLELEYDAIIIQVGLMKNWWQLSYSYDKTVSKLIQTNTGAHELSLLMRFKYTKRNRSSCRERYLRKKRRVGRIKCPKF
jgi:type IX secretion system PorP/SprF family membrane protein